MAVNKFRAPCAVCGNEVPANGGNLDRSGRRWIVRHLACAKGPAVIEIRTSGGSFIRNAKGRCEDAPCCGCCTI
jgi:hypothetical protein